MKQVGGLVAILAGLLFFVLYQINGFCFRSFEHLSREELLRIAVAYELEHTESATVDRMQSADDFLAAYRSCCTATRYGYSLLSPIYPRTEVFLSYEEIRAIIYLDGCGDVVDRFWIER